MRALLLATLLLAPALAGCAAPSGVNPDAYRVGTPPTLPERRENPELAELARAMREHASPRAALADEAAYDRYLAEATRWAREGLDARDAERAFNASHPEAALAFDALEGLANATRGSDKELLAGPAARTALALRWMPDGANATLAEEMVAHAREALVGANASVHAARLATPAEGRNALLRAEAVLGFALTQLAGAEDALRAVGRDDHAAVSALDARVGAAAVAFWLAEAERASAAAPAGAAPVAWPDGLPALTQATLDRAAAAVVAARSGAAEAQPALTNLVVGVNLVRALQRAELPEGAWAASQGLKENILVLELLLGERAPTPEEVAHAWQEAFEHVRTFRDAQRYDRALAALDIERRPFGDGAYRGELLGAYAAVALMREISEERERVLAA